MQFHNAIDIKSMFKSSNKSEHYEKYIGGQYCIVRDCYRKPITPHHLHKRSNDFLALPMCADHHREIDTMVSKFEFFDKYNVSITCDALKHYRPEVYLRVIFYLIEYIKQGSIGKL